MKPRSEAEIALVHALNDLAELDDREVRTYQAALRHVPAEDRSSLLRLQEDHRRHAAYLKLLILTLGGHVTPHEAQEAAFLTRSFLLLASVIGEKAVLERMKRDEDRVTRAYLVAMSRPLPACAHSVMEKALREQLQHAAWIERALADGGVRGNGTPMPSGA